MFAYGQSSVFPNGTYQAANYWVDVLFAMPKPGMVTNATRDGRASVGDRLVVGADHRRSGRLLQSDAVRRLDGAARHDGHGHAPGDDHDDLRPDRGHGVHVHRPGIQRQRGGTASAPSDAGDAAVVGGAGGPDRRARRVRRPRSARVSWTAPAGESGADLTAYTVTPYVGATAQTPKQVDPADTATTVTGLENGTSYTFEVRATNSAGTSPASVASAAVIPQDTLFDFATPGTIDSGDPSAIEVGMKFSSDVDGVVRGIRFYKAAANTGAHSGSLWSAAGSRLAEVTFTGESASGWQTALFSTPVAITAGTTYVASYFAPTGRYSVDGGAFSSVISNPPLQSLSNAVSQNGVYAYGALEPLPHQHVQRRQLLGRRAVRVLPAAGPGHERHGRRRPRDGGRLVDAPRRAAARRPRTRWCPTSVPRRSRPRR